MENVIDLYHRPEAAAYPLVCVDETSKQHIQEVRQPLGAVKGSPSRYDAEYQRNGVSNLSILPKMFESPLPLTHENKLVLTSYFKHSPFPDAQIEDFPPTGAFISNLSQLLAWEDPTLRDLADYYRSTDITGAGEEAMRLWDGTVYSQGVRCRVEADNLHNEPWNESSWVFPYLQRGINTEYIQNEEFP